MNFTILDKINIDKDFALFKNNESQVLNTQYKGKILIHGNGFIQLLQVSDLSFAVLTNIDTSKKEKQFEYTIVLFDSIEWLSNYISFLKMTKTNSNDVLHYYEQHLSEIIHSNVPFKNIGSDVILERPYMLYRAFSKYDGQIYKSIRLINIEQALKDKIRIFSLIYTFYAKQKTTMLHILHYKKGSTEVIGLCKPIKRG